MGCCGTVTLFFSGEPQHFSPLPTRSAQFGRISYRTTTVSGRPTFQVRKCRRPSGAPATVLRCNCQLSSEIAPLTSAAYGTLLLGGGLFAYSRTKSTGSLVGGLTGATLMGTAYFLMQASETKELGDALAFGSSLLFSSVFGIRLVASRKLVPAGPLLAISFGALAVFVLAYLRDKI
ncbi:unnamed protein product [Cuscuta campestris]|uniref:Protein FATTY ACID EXPORT 4, chloroplastic n=2 Tax=Cuscuta sect. Cleistogrammica TaxID=1824901 RepID=A0A484L6J9_9ASTE|nr:hypothetical protein DM860_007153 [Cuscuta australis]VFQ71918.1 unnamed protein product [Cuscuta campestris]